MKTSNILVAGALSALFSSAALAHGAKKDLNCEINGQKEYVKSEKVCAKRKGTWLTSVATTSGSGSGSGSSVQVAPTSAATPAPETSAPSTPASTPAK